MIRLEEIYKNRRVLITGGFGFVGSHLAKRLVECGAEITVLDIATDLMRRSLINCPVNNVRSAVRVIKADVNNREFLCELLADYQFDYIFNCAAHAAVIEKAVDEPAATIMTNTLGVVSLLEAVRETGCYPRGIFHASTDKVYGELQGADYEEEKTPLRAIGVYDASKLAADLLTRTYHEVFEIPVTILRMCNLFGPYDFNTEYRLIPKSFSSIFTGECPQLYMDSLDHYREYLYIDDAVEVILEMTVRQSCVGEAFNLMGSQYISTGSVMQKIVDAASQVMNYRNTKDAEMIRSRRYVVVERVAAGKKIISLKKQRLNAEKLKGAIEFRPRVSFEEGLARTAEFYRYFYHDVLAAA